MKILFVVPSFSLIGGVANHYQGLSQYWAEEIVYCVQGRRKKLPAYFWLIPDYVTFVLKVLYYRPQLVVINPSLRSYMLFRDGLYLLLAKLFRRKVVCFFHGWDINLAEKLEKCPKIFNKVFGKSDLVYVLCSDFKKTLERMNFPGLVKLNTTKVDDSLLEGFSIASRTRKVTNILYLARVDRNKGIYVAIDAFEILQKDYPFLHLTIVGNGCDKENAEKYVSKKHLPNVHFTGGLRGKDLADQFAKGDIYILPTYFEGMATSVLEAMAFGLPVLTAPVGGVKDFFVESEMGFLIDSYSAQDYADNIKILLENSELYRRISYNNYQYAHQNFMASIVTRKMECDFKVLVERK